MLLPKSGYTSISLKQCNNQAASSKTKAALLIVNTLDKTTNTTLSSVNIMPNNTPNNVSELFLTTKELANADTNNTGIITPQKLVYLVCSKANVSLEDDIPLQEIDKLAKRFVATVRNELHNPLVGSAINSFVVLELNRESMNSSTPADIGKKLKHFAAALHKFLVDLDTALVEGDNENTMIALDALNRFEGAIDGKLPVKIDVEFLEKSMPIQKHSASKFSDAIAVAQSR